MNTRGISKEIRETSWQLLPERAIWWADMKTLIVADLHIGKVSHFRKNGIAIPENAGRKDLERLMQLLREYKPERLLILGDLFHSVENDEWQGLSVLHNLFPFTKLQLVEGNHDILHADLYRKAQIDLIPDSLIEGPFVFSHEPLEILPEGLLNVCGHLHPGIRLHGKALQSARLPCFFYSPKRFILPAFSEFSGLHILSPKKKDLVYGIVGESVVAFTE